MQYVRMCSVLEKFVAESKQRYGRAMTTEDLSTADVALLTHEEEWKIVLQLTAFPDAIAKASAEFEPSIVARHLIELASLTSTWWTATRDTRIVGDDAALTLARVRLVNAIRKVLGRGLTLLGMSLVERM
jgi:arginyl-tRNA synthetase